MKIVDALEKLDLKNDDHWTISGLPKVDTVETILGRSTTRQEITEAAPQFSRMLLIKREEELAAAMAEPVSQSDSEPTPQTASETTSESNQPSDDEAPQESAKETAATTEPTSASEKVTVKVIVPEEETFDKNRERFNQVTADIEDIRKEMKKLDDLLQEKIREQNTLYPLVQHDDYDHNEDQKARMEYIASQTKAREKRIANAKAAAGNVGAFPSQLDAAMARRTARGMQRPSIPLKTG